MNRSRSRQVIIGVGLGFAALTAISGVTAEVFQQHDESLVSREVFANVPSALKLAFYTLLPVLFVYGAVLFSQRAKNWSRGRPDNRATTARNAKRRMADLRSGLYMKTLMREPGAGIMHSLIYFNFIILAAVTTVLEVNHQVPESWKFLHGDVYRGYALIGDLAGLGFTAGVVMGIVRRYGPKRWRPYRIAIKSRPEHMVILGVLLAIGVTGFGAEMFRIAVNDRPDFEQWSVVGYPLSVPGP